jgi:hypothetical protein
LLAGVCLFQFAHSAIVRDGLRIDPLPDLLPRSFGYSRLNFRSERMALVTSPRPGRPLRRGFGGSKAVRNWPERLRRAGSSANTVRYCLANLRANAAISLHSACGNVPSIRSRIRRAGHEGYLFRFLNSTGTFQNSPTAPTMKRS